MKWASSKISSASFQDRIFSSASAPVMKNSSVPSPYCLRRSRRVSMVYVGPGRSMSTRLTENRGLDAVAMTVIRYRSSDGLTSTSPFCHGCPVGTNTTSYSLNRLATSLAATRWPWWIGSNVPPITPTLRRTPTGQRSVGCSSDAVTLGILADPSPDPWQGRLAVAPPGHPDRLADLRPRDRTGRQHPHVTAQPQPLPQRGVDPTRSIDIGRFARHHEPGRGAPAVQHQQVVRAHRPVSQQHRLDLTGVHVHAADDQHVVGAAGDLAHPDGGAPVAA